MADKVVVQYEVELKKLKKDFKELKKEVRDTQKTATKSAKKIEGGFNKVSGTLKNLRNQLIAAFAIGALLRFSKELFDTAIQMEAFKRRAQIVFGDAFKFVDDFAKKSGVSMGFARTQFLGAAAAIGDLIVPLGLSRQKAAEMSVGLLKTASAVKEFSGDTRDAAELSSLFARALTGEVESLKPLGVSVSLASKEFKELVAIKIEDEGVTELQAKALAIYETILLRSTDAITAFETNQDSATRQVAILTARIGDQKEALAEDLLPAFGELLDFLNNAVIGYKTLSSRMELYKAALRSVIGLTTEFSSETLKNLAEEGLTKSGKKVSELTAGIQDLTEAQLKGSRVLQGFVDALVEEGEKANEARQIVRFLAQERLNELEVIRKANEARGDGNELTEEEIKNVFFFTAAIKKLTEERAAQGTAIERIAEINVELIPLQERLNELMGKAGTAASNLSGGLDGVTESLLDFDEALKLSNEEFQIFIDQNELIDESFAKTAQGVIENMEIVEDARGRLLQAQLDFAQETISIFQGIAQEGSVLAKVLFAFEQGLAVAEIIVSLQREIALINANPALSLLPDAGITAKAALAASARVRAATGVATVIATTVAGVQGFAGGTTDAPEGMAWVGEKGPELMMIPKGSHVYSNQASNQYRDELEAANRGDLENLITSKYIVPALRQSTSIRNEWDDSNILRENRRLRREGSPMSNADYLAKKIAKEMKQENVTQRLYGS